MLILSMKSITITFCHGFSPGILLFVEFLAHVSYCILIRAAQGRAQPTSHTGESWGKGQKRSMPSIFLSSTSFNMQVVLITLFSLVSCASGLQSLWTTASWSSKPDILSTTLLIFTKFACSSSERKPACFSKVQWLKWKEGSVHLQKERQF